MKIALVSPATVVDFGRQRAHEPSVRQLAEHVPLGVLTLIAILRERSFDVELIDPNAVYYEQRSRSCAEALTDRLVAGAYDLVGFGTLSSSFPLVLRVATALKRARSSTAIVLGGPQASVVDRATLAQFGAVDFVLRGEADDSLPQLVRALEAGNPLPAVPALSYRQNDAVVQNPAGALPLELDRLPLPAYDCAPALAAAATLPLEVGRGCPYGCTFCSTNNFFSRRFRMKSPARVLEQLHALHERYGVTRFDFVHDMLTVVRSEVVELCQALIDAGSPYQWYASARTDRVDGELLELMEAAGCRGLFFGIETGSAKLQRSLKKRLDLQTAMSRVAQAAEHQLDVVVSLITGFPEEELEDVRGTVDVFVRSLRLSRVSPQLHLLAPLAGTPIYAQYRDRLVFDDVMSDMSHSGWAPERDDITLIASHPEVFPNFYGVPTPTDRQLLKELRLFLLEAATAFRWLLLGLHLRGHAFDVLLQFRAARATRVAAADLQGYYSGSQFRADFLRFVRERLATDPALGALLTIAECAQASATAEPVEVVGDRPRRCPGVALARIAVDFAALMAALAAGTDLSGIPAREVTVAVRAAADGPEMFELPIIAARVLQLCDGERSSASISRALSAEARAAGVSVERLYAAALAALQSAKLVTAPSSSAEFSSSIA